MQLTQLTAHCWKIYLTQDTKGCFGFHSALREAMQNPMQKWGSSIIMDNFWEVWILSIGGLMSIKREEVCTMVWLFWLFYPGDRASGLLLSWPVTSVKHSDNFFLTNSLCPLCENTPTVDITIIPVVVSIFVGTKLAIAKLWGLHELVKRLEFSFGVFGTSICWRTECLSCQAVLSLFKLMGEANANANGLLSTALSLCRLDLCLKGELFDNKNPIEYLQPLQSSERLQYKRAQ